MDTDELALLCSSALSVKEMEGPVKTLDAGLINKRERRLSLCLVGKVLTSKLINREVFMNVIQSVWQISEGVEIEWIEGNIFAFRLTTLRIEDSRFIRVRVVIDVNEPLLRSLRVDLLDNGKISTMLLRYERLLDYCFKCGCLGHSLLECKATDDDMDVKSEANLRLNVWLCTGSPPKHFLSQNRKHDRPWGWKPDKGHYSRSSDN
ncbi:hypothetical protein Ddye_020254 [Dipteronia dyeriana]|uniref:Zinc knuckle CX2CX4HX4C domain-containing protein n=1 Tax=Dipteronia dyeriana TaxID=168575 RepID=A0AAD9WV77_9ROSI|nr:hypothetical protein Ddye_020254 [Dipteronia dyeriana]